MRLFKKGQNSTFFLKFSSEFDLFDGERETVAMSSHTNTRRVAKNTLMLYFRQILIMLVSLYTVRVVLAVLGVEDYGIFNVVAGVVTMFSFVSGAMATASQRYLSFELGRCDNERLKLVFSVTFKSYLLIAGIILLLAETVGLWFVHTKLNIPTERLTAARVIYQFSIFSSLATVMTIPYMSAIIAHEEMKIYAYVSIVEAVLKLAVALVIPYILFDSLMAYSFLVMLVVFINTAIYRQISKRKFEECRSGSGWDRDLFVEMLSFSGWNLFGASVGIMKTQGINILVNQFFAPGVVAARSVANQVRVGVGTFSQSFTSAVRPQIVKNYAAGEMGAMTRLVYRSCKYTYALMFLFALPFIFLMGDLLPLWLKNPPLYAVIFSQLALIDSVIDSVSYPLMTVAQATGKIRLYQALVGSTLLLNLPISYCFLKAGYSAVAVYGVAISITTFAFALRLWVLRRLVRFKIVLFFRKVIIPILLFTLLSILLPLYLSGQQISSAGRVIGVLGSSLLVAPGVGFFVLFNREEQNWLRKMIVQKISFHQRESRLLSSFLPRSLINRFKRVK